AMLERQQEADRRQRDRMRRREALEAQILALRKEFELEEDEAATAGAEEVSREQFFMATRDALARSRGADKVREITASEKRIRDKHEKVSKR
ncbi:MAG: hypothetical protein WAM47_03220, partial [Candidatus Sulfotelmatobacter sp.]